MNLSAVILAGGRSRRMGRDKAFIEIEGRTLLLHALMLVRKIGVTEVFVSGRADADYSAAACPVLSDVEPGLGPVAGIERGLNAATNPLLLVLAVDMPKLNAEALTWLINACDNSTGIVPRLRDQLEPLAAIYPRRAAEEATRFLRAGQRAARGFSDHCAAHNLVRIVDVPDKFVPCFDNWNEPQDIA